MTDINPEGKYDEDVNVGNVNKSVIKLFGDTVFEKTLDKDPGKDKVHEKPEKRDVVVYINPEDVHMNNVMDEIFNTGMFNTKYEFVVVDIKDVGMRNMEYEADSINTEVGIEAYRGRKLSMHEQPEMLKTNPKCKNMNVDITNGVMFVKEYEADTQDHQDGEINMFKEAEIRMLKINPKYKNVNVDIIDAVMYEKPEMRDVMDDITHMVTLKHGVRGWHQDPLRKGTQHMGEERDEGWDAQDHCQGQVRQEREREQRDEQEQHGHLDQRPEAVLLSV